MDSSCYKAKSAIRVKKQPPMNHDGWMVSDHETVFILCSSSLLTKVVGSVVGLFLIMYPLTTHKQEGSKKQSFPIN
jgi:hypothetical protein